MSKVVKLFFVSVLVLALQRGSLCAVDHHRINRRRRNQPQQGSGAGRGGYGAERGHE